MSDPPTPSPNWPAFAHQVIESAVRGVKPSHHPPPTSSDTSHHPPPTSSDTSHDPPPAGGDLSSHDPPPRSGDPSSHGGVFVTLKKLGRLRGCMGTLDGSQPLDEAIRHIAATAALSDPRFPPVTSAELPDLTIEVSVLSEPWPMGTIDDLQLGTHGIIVRKGIQRGLFLPQVATEHHLDKHTFLSRCAAEKAGLPPDAWKDANTEVLLFTANIFRE